MSDMSIKLLFEAMDKFSEPVKKMKEAMEKFEKETEKVHTKLQKFSLATKQISKGLMVGVTMPLIGAASYAAKNALQFDELKLSLQAVLGSAENAGKAFDLVKKAAMETGAPIEGLNRAFQILGSHGESFEQTQELFRQVKILAIGAGVEVESLASQMGGIMYKAMSGKGIDARALNRIGKGALPIMEEIKRLLNVKSNDELSKRLNGATIGADVFLQAMKNLTKEGSKFMGVFKSRTETPEAAMERIHNSVRAISADFGDTLLKIFGVDEKMGSLADRFEKAEEKFKSFLDNNQGLIKMAVYIGIFAAALAPIAAGLSIVATIMTILSAATLPITGMVLAIAVAAGAIAFGLYKAYQAAQKFGGVVIWIKHLWEEFVNFAIDSGKRIIESLPMGKYVTNMFAHVKQEHAVTVAGSVGVSVNGQKPVQAPLKQVDNGQSTVAKHGGGLLWGT